MIKLIPNPTFESDVVLTPLGSAVPVKAKFTFKVLPIERLIGILIMTKVVKKNIFRRGWEYAKLCWRAKRRAGVVDMQHELIQGWSGFDLPYSRKALAILCTEYPAAAINILKTYFEQQEEGRRKN